MITPLVPQISFNFATMLDGAVASASTKRAYYQWVDRFLVDVVGLEPTERAARVARMQALPLNALLPYLNVPHVRAWFATLRNSHASKSSFAQAHAAVVKLTELLNEAGWVDDATTGAIGRVKPPKAESGQRIGRWLSVAELKSLVAAVPAKNTSAAARDRALLAVMCTMGLRREEVASLTWGDLSVQNGKPSLRVHGKGNKVRSMQVPAQVVAALSAWRKVVGEPELATAMFRQVNKTAAVGTSGLSGSAVDGIVKAAAARAGLGDVAPHDLRRSVAGALYENGVSVDEISKLLGHSNVAVTQKYLGNMKPANGAEFMAELLKA